MSKAIKLDSYKEFTPQNLSDELQKMIDNNDVEDLIIISRNGDNIHLMTSPLSDTDSIGILEIIKTNIALGDL